MKLRVGCYARGKADERPVRFQQDGRDYLVEEVLYQWYGPNGTFFKVRADDRNPYTLRRNTPRDEWTIESIWAAQRLAGWRIAGPQRLLGRFVDGRFLLGSSRFLFGMEPVVEFRTWSTASLEVEFVSSPSDSIFKRERFDWGFLCMRKCRHNHLRRLHWHTEAQTGGRTRQIAGAYGGGLEVRRRERCAKTAWQCERAPAARRQPSRTPVSREAPRIIFRQQCPLGYRYASGSRANLANWSLVTSSCPSSSDQHRHGAMNWHRSCNRPAAPIQNWPPGNHAIRLTVPQT